MIDQQTNVKPYKKNFESLQGGPDTKPEKREIKADYGHLYGLNQTQLGKRAQSIPAEEVRGSRRDLSLSSIPADYLPTLDSRFTLGDDTKSWLGVYSQSYYDSNGNIIYTFKTVACDLGSSIVAETLTDTLTLTSSNGSLLITGYPLSDTADILISINTGAFNALLSAADNTLQKALDTIDNKALNKSGDTATGVIGFDSGFSVKEGTNKRMGAAVLVAGVVTVNTTAVTANSRIFLTSQADGGTPGFVRISARVAATSFTITSSNVADTSTIAWLIVEPI